MHTIERNPDDKMTGTCAGRPVRFSQSLWRWIYLETPDADPVQKVVGQVFVRDGNAEPPLRPFSQNNT